MSVLRSQSHFADYTTKDFFDGAGLLIRDESVKTMV